MPARASLTLRWARASLLGAVAFAAGIGAHVSADGLLPGPTGLAALLALCATGSAVFLGREASTFRLVALLIGGQAFVHTGLAALAGHRGETATTGPATTFHPAAVSGPRGSLFDSWAQSNPALHSGAGGPAVPAWAVHAVNDVADRPLMAFMHVLAAAVVGLWLAIGERALFAVLTLSATWVCATVATLSDLIDSRPTAPRLPALRSTAYAVARTPRINVRARPVRRGPPALLPAR